MKDFYKTLTDFIIATMNLSDLTLDIVGGIKIDKKTKTVSFTHTFHPIGWELDGDETDTSIQGHMPEIEAFFNNLDKNAHINLEGDESDEVLEVLQGYLRYDSVKVSFYADSEWEGLSYEFKNLDSFTNEPAVKEIIKKYGYNSDEYDDEDEDNSITSSSNSLPSTTSSSTNVPTVTSSSAPTVSQNQPAPKKKEIHEMTDEELDEFLVDVRGETLEEIKDAISEIGLDYNEYRNILRKLSKDKPEDVLEALKDTAMYEVPGAPLRMNRKQATEFWQKVGSANILKNLDDKMHIVYGDKPYLEVKNKAENSISLVELGGILAFAQENGYEDAKYDKIDKRIYLTVPTEEEQRLWEERGDNPQSPLEKLINSQYTFADVDPNVKDAKKAGIRKTSSKEDLTHVNEAINFGIMSSAISPELIENSEAFKRLNEKLNDPNLQLTESKKERLLHDAYEDFIDERKLAGDTLPWRMILGV